MTFNKVAVSLIMLAVSISTNQAFAAGKKTTIQGILGTTANGRSSFITAGDKEYYFDPVSKAGKKIWNVCERDQICIVTGLIKSSLMK